MQVGWIVRVAAVAALAGLSACGDPSGSGAAAGAAPKQVATLNAPARSTSLPDADDWLRAPDQDASCGTPRATRASVEYGD